MNKQTNNINMTRADIYQRSIDNFKEAFPHLNAYREIADRLFMDEKTLRAKIHCIRNFTIQEEEQFFVICNFPAGYKLIQARVFLKEK